MYDVIGDVHGSHDALKRLLIRMGYVKRASGYTHRERQAIFVGDLLNRGNAVEKVIKLVRRMQDSGAAQVVMGNHEFNTLAYHIPNPNHKDVYLRPRSKKNQKQLSATLNQLSKDEIESTLAWIRGLPMYLDLPEIRVVHACWDPWAIKRIVKAHAEFGQWTDEFMHKALDPGKKLAKAIEWTLKGKEQSLPMGEGLTDLDGFYRSRLRVRWYLPPEGKTYAEYALVRDNDLPQIPLPAALDDKPCPYEESEKPVFIGHYGLRPNPEPALLAKNVACIDYGVARGDVLCAYRWDGEQVLEADHLVWVKV
jgi:hypothetical protein